MKIGIIGTGNIGSTLARLWARAGHEILVSSRHPSALDGLADELGDSVSTGTPEEAAQFGETVLLSIPFGGIQDTVPALARYLEGKTVIDTMNPFPSRDGEVAEEAQKRGPAGLTTAAALPGAKVIRAFSSVHYQDLRYEAGRKNDRIAVPFAGDIPEAKATAAHLIRDAGFDPYDLGNLSDSSPLDPGGILFGKSLTAKEIDELRKQ